MTQPTQLNFVTCPYGKKGSWAAGYHTGIDYRAAPDTPVFATRAGRIVHEGYGGAGEAYGKHIIIESEHCGMKIRHLYAHLNKSWVNVNERVTAGKEIGISGTTGNITGPHLHYEERVSPFGYYNHIPPVLPQWQPVRKKWLRAVMRRIGVNPK